MKLTKSFILGLVFFCAPALAAEQTSTPSQQPAATKDPHSAGTYSWQQCVDDHMKEGGHTREQAYTKCEKMQ